MTKREKERKIKMIGLIGMSLLVISSLATATYAWFVQYPATVNTGTMTVLAPNEYSYYSYEGNLDSAHELKGTFAQDFKKITSENIASETSFTGTYPGQSKVYCIHIANRNPENSVTLNLNKFMSNNSHDQGETYRRYIQGSSTEINIGWAIDITSMASQDGSGYSTWIEADSTVGDIFTTDPTATDDTVNFPNSVLNSNSKGSGSVITLASPVTIFSATTQQNNWSSIYVFYRVCFSDDEDTLFVEKNGDQDNVIKTTGDREFVKDGTNGTSNCYAGLEFRLVELEMTF